MTDILDIAQRVLEGNAQPDDAGELAAWVIRVETYLRASQSDQPTVTISGDQEVIGKYIRYSVMRGEEFK